MGVLVIGALLLFLGGGLVLGGIYLGIARADTGWMPWASALLVGPAVLYSALHLLRLTHWSWLAMVLLLALLLASSIGRAVTAPTIPVSPLVEIGIELAVLGYLVRRPVRRAFARRP